MKKQLFLYLFILSALLNVFTYSYFTRKETFEKKQQASRSSSAKDSLNVLYNQLVEANYFALENNDNAKEYFYNANLDYTKIIPLVKNALIDYNGSPKGNPYTDQAADGEKKFSINKIKLLNHRWLIADYSNGELWGEALIKYFINKDQTVSFETIQTYLYPKQIE